MKRLITAATAAILAGSASAGDQVFVGGPAGAVYVADSDTGAFTYFACFCIGPIESIQPFGSDLLVADSFGGLWILDGTTGVFENGAWTGIQLRDMAIDGATPLVVDSAGDIQRINMNTGQSIETITTPAPATAVLTFDDTVFAGTADGRVLRRSDGSWTTIQTFTHAIATLAVRDSGLMVVDDDGNTAVLDWMSGGPINAYYASPGITAAAAAGDMNLLTDQAGTVYVYDNATGVLSDTWTAPIEVGAVFVRPGNVCQADVNRNATLDAGDFTAWLAAYSRGDFDADQNTDLQLTPADFTAWLANFNAGCD